MRHLPLGYVLCLGSFVLITVAVAATRLIRRHELRSLQEINTLVARLLTKSIAKKLGETPAQIRDILLDKRESAELSRRFDESVAVVELIFRRTSKPSQVQLEVRLKYRDGESFSASLERHWDSLPAPAREAFLRSGQPRVTFPWIPPWRSE